MSQYPQPAASSGVWGVAWEEPLDDSRGRSASGEVGMPKAEVGRQ